ncbi:MAG: hypothetical protein ACM3KR_10280 [Deltaproteobacteria bacterium]
MNKIFETFSRDIKREFNDVTTVDREITALDIDEYVLTQNVENILGCFAAYFFDDAKMFPNLKMQCQLLQDKYRDRVGPGVWIRGFFGAGKSHLLKIINTMFASETIPYIENGVQKELDVIKTIQTGIRDSRIAELIANIRPKDYITFVFCASHITKTGDTIVDCLPKEVSRQLGLPFEENKKYSARDVSEFLQKILKDSGKKRMLIFVDEILDVLDDGDKVRKFEGLIELLDNNIWFVVTSLEAKTKLLTTVTAERMIHRFGQEQILLPEEMVRIVKNRYLAKTDEGRTEIEKHINLDKMKYHFAHAYLSDGEDGKIELPNMIASYPFYPFQLAYMKDLLKNESKGSARNMMKTVKSIVKNPEVYNKSIGYFIDIELIYEELKSKRSIEDEYSDLILSLDGSNIIDDNNRVIEKAPLLKTLKAIVLLSQVKPEGIKANAILPFVYNEDGISDENKLKDYLEILTKENYINNEGGIYKPITKKESDVWTRIKNISSITESAIRDYINTKIYGIFNTKLNAGKNQISGKINNFSKDIAFVLKASDISNELSSVYSCIPFSDDVEKLKVEALNASNNKEKMFIIPSIKYEGEALYKATRFYLQMEQALKRESDFGIDKNLRIQIETKKDTAIDGEIDKMIEDCLKNSTLSYLGQENKDYSTSAAERVLKECEAMLKKKYTMFFGKLLRDEVSTFIQKEILAPTHKLTSQYLKDLDLVDNNGTINTGNRYYNEFMKSFPDNGFEKDGISVIDEFSKGKYGWELDIIKILTALAVKNGELKIALQGRTFNIPEDIGELVGNSGPFASRTRKNFDNFKFTKINISDEEIRNAILAIKYIDSNMAVEIKLKDVAVKIKELLSKVSDLSDFVSNYSEFFNDEQKNNITWLLAVNNDIKKRNDAEEIVVTFNGKITDESAKIKAKQVIYFADNAKNLSIVSRAYTMFKNANSLKVAEKIMALSQRFLSGELSAFDEVVKEYKTTYQESYREYEKSYNAVVDSIKAVSEWSNLTNTQQQTVLKGISFTKINGFNFDGLKTLEVGTYEDLRRLIAGLSDIKIVQTKLVHTYNDDNNRPQPQPQQTSGGVNEPPSSPISTRITRKFKSYSEGKIINIDSVDKLSELDAEFLKIKEKIKVDLEKGNKITLEL